MHLLLAIDAGTTSLKAGLFNAQGECLGIERHEYRLETPKVDWAQVDPEVYWQACVQAVHSLLELEGVQKEAIAALAVSSQGETILAVDEHGKPVYPAIVWLDNRAAEEARQLSGICSVKRFTGVAVFRKSSQPGAHARFYGCAHMSRKRLPAVPKSSWCRISSFRASAAFMPPMDPSLALVCSTISISMAGGRKCWMRWG